MENRIKLALAVHKASKSDSFSAVFMSDTLRVWKRMRNDVAHNEGAYKNYMEEAYNMEARTNRVVEMIKRGVELIESTGWPGRCAFLRDVVKLVNEV